MAFSVCLNIIYSLAWRNEIKDIDIFLITIGTYAGIKSQENVNMLKLATNQLPLRPSQAAAFSVVNDNGEISEVTYSFILIQVSMPLEFYHVSQFTKFGDSSNLPFHPNELAAIHYSFSSVQSLSHVWLFANP